MMKGFPVQWKKRVYTAIAVMLFCACLIVAMAVLGDPANSIHKSIEENSWWVFISTLGIWMLGEGTQQWASLREMVKKS